MRIMNFAANVMGPAAKQSPLRPTCWPGPTHEESANEKRSCHVTGLRGQCCYFAVQAESITMTVIARENLQYQYSWAAIPPDDQRKTGNPDSVLLNRREGYEVLYFLNRICTNLPQALKAERLIQTRLPGDVRSRANVLDWLIRNWDMLN